MENGYLKLYGHGSMVKGSDDDTVTTSIVGKFDFNKDIAYLYTAALLAEVGMLLKDKAGYVAGGVKTPASALGHDLTERILEKLDCSLEIKEE